ncbi:MAG: hypothetical protein ABFD08_19740 [Syntrophomonas sp.]
MEWQKKGLVYVPDGKRSWARGTAYLPTVDILNSKVLRVYFASLDENKYGRIGYVDLDIDNPQRILKESPEPVLDLGEYGTFDDCGVSPCCILNIQGKKYLYYFGWQRCSRVPYMLFAGLAAAGTDGCFHRVSRVPVLDRTSKEPFVRSAISVIEESGMFQAWYVSARQWINIGNTLYPSYVIRYADSHDGIKWNDYDHICIDFESEDEFGFGRPWVVKEKSLYRMWYSIRSRSKPYRIGYAESGDGVSWQRKDQEAGIEKSASGWDSEMICFPCVVRIGGLEYMFYNGNQHGASGFGYAVREQCLCS